MERAKLPTNETLNPLVLNRNKAMNWLIDTFPKAFDLRNRKPLKENIVADILNHPSAQGKPDEAAIRQALDYYTQWGSYLSSLQLGARRIDLDGIAISFVTKQAADSAKETLQKAQQKLKS